MARRPVSLLGDDKLIVRAAIFIAALVACGEPTVDELEAPPRIDSVAESFCERRAECSAAVDGTVAQCAVNVSSAIDAALVDRQKLATCVVCMTTHPCGTICDCDTAS